MTRRQGNRPHRTPPPGEPRKPRRATLADVARHVGVASMTVSRALRNPDTVSAELRARIHAAVAELGYVPNRTARSLVSSTTNTVAVVVPNLSNAVYADTIQGIHDGLSAHGYQIFLGNSAFQPEQEEAFLSTVLGWPPEGLILTGVDHTANARAMLKRSGLPVVETMELTSNPIDGNVGYSHTNVGRDVASYLLSRGYRRLGFVGAAMEHDYRAQRRWEGFRAEIAKVGAHPPEALTYDQIATFAMGGQALARIRDRNPDLDAVFFVNDTLAVGAILTAGELGVSIPDQLAIMGFNGLDIGTIIRPRLSTVISPRYDIGRHAADLLSAQLKGDYTGSKRIEVPYQLCPRESA